MVMFTRALVFLFKGEGDRARRCFWGQIRLILSNHVAFCGRLSRFWWVHLPEGAGKDVGFQGVRLCQGVRHVALSPIGEKIFFNVGYVGGFDVTAVMQF